jgi:hypothetical protein
VPEPPLPATAYFAIIESAGHGRDVSGPKRMPYGPDYYAVFFADPCGNRFEVYFRRAS